MCFNFLTGRTGPSMGPQSSADKAAGGYVPPSYKSSRQTNTANPHSDTATSQGQRAAVQTKQTADRNTIRRADSYGKSASSTTPSASVVPGAEKIKQTFQSKTAKRTVDKTAVKKKKRIATSTSYSSPFRSWQGTTSRSGKTILGA